MTAAGRRRGISLLVVLVLAGCGLLVSGCASAAFRPARLPGTAPDAGAGAPEIEVGPTVRVTTRSGEEVTGLVRTITPDTLVVVADPESPVPATRVPTAAIVSVGLQYADTKEKGMFYVIFGVAALAVYGLVSFVHSVGG